ncbi:MAG: putative phosphoribosyltransferase [Vicingaceae bacterium]|jgi:predicted phosphoribosyltransferase
MFANRLQAGELLAKKLFLFKNDRKTIVVAIPNGGVLTAYPIVKALNLPLELQLVKKIPHPDDAKITIGAISLTDTFFNEDCGVTASYFESEANTYKELLVEKYNQFIGRKAVLNLSGKTVILVDDGMQTGSTVELAIQLIKKQHPSKIILAVPISPQKVIDKLKDRVDEVFCLKYFLPEEALSEHYKDFNAVGDSSVVRLLKE